MERGMADTSLASDRKAGAVHIGRRVLRLLLSPAKEFERIASEIETIRAVIIGWILPLVSIMIVGNIVRAMVFGIGDRTGFGRFYPMAQELPALALPLMAQSVAMPFVMAFVINMLAGFFGGHRDYVQAVRTAAYVGTPAWLVGIVGPAWQLDAFSLMPPLSVGLFVGVAWSIYLLWRALPRTMKSSYGAKALAYTAAVSAVMFVLWIPALLLTFAITSKLLLKTLVIPSR
jgi:hypothetical protein